MILPMLMVPLALVSWMLCFLSMRTISIPIDGVAPVALCECWCCSRFHTGAHYFFFHCDPLTSISNPLQCSADDVTLYCSVPLPTTSQVNIHADHCSQWINCLRHRENVLLKSIKLCFIAYNTFLSHSTITLISPIEFWPDFLSSHGSPGTI